jgi:hypothetical protein
LAWAFTPQPKDDADAEAPLLVKATALTTGVVKIAKHALLTTPWFNLPFAC